MIGVELCELIGGCKIILFSHSYSCVSQTVSIKKDVPSFAAWLHSNPGSVAGSGALGLG